MRIVMADDGIPFDGSSIDTGPLGGAETAFVSLAEALAARGHDVCALSHCAAPLVRNGVEWTPIGQEAPAGADLYIGNRGHRVVGLVPNARKRVFWLHNPAQYLRKPRIAWPLTRYRPTLVVTGEYHASTIPKWLPCAAVEIIPYGMLDRFRHGDERQPPPPRAIFTSNPLRGLDWLLDLWTSRIAPAVPGAELHIYAGSAVYVGGPADKLRQMDNVVERADALFTQGVRRHVPVGRDALSEVLGRARVMLYRGDLGETFCLSLAEAQAMGVPAVVQPIGSVIERVIDGETGRIAATDDAFAEAAIAALRDNELWRTWHRAALSKQRGLSWDEVAGRFEALAA